MNAYKWLNRPIFKKCNVLVVHRNHCCRVFKRKIFPSMNDFNKDTKCIKYKFYQVTAKK